MISTDSIKWIMGAVALAVYTALVVFATLKLAMPDFAGLISGSDRLAEELQEAHDEELARIQDLHDKELSERDRILDEYQKEIETARNDYWATITQIETQIRAQRAGIIDKIYENPDAAAKILEDQYGIIYVP
jgi:DNA repair exonuclease SbcCD ATPase subunit